MTKMTRTIAVMVVAAGFVFVTSAAQALPSISMIWRENGTATIGTPSVSVSSIVIADIVITGDSTNFVIGVFVSFEYDVAELFAIGAAELTSVNLPGMGNSFSPITLGVSLIDNTNGLIEGFDQATLNTGLNGSTQTRTLGSVRFHLVSVLGGDVDLIASVQGNLDTIGFSTGPGSANFLGARVPEPTTAILVIAGLAGLGYAGRRSLR